MCPSCSWPNPALVSSHGFVSYLRCVCGQWLIVDHGEIVAMAGTSAFTRSTPVHHGCGGPITIMVDDEPS